MIRFLLVVLAAAVAIPALAQGLAESVEVRVIELEAVVLDKAGKPVRGLARTDFEVKIDGKPAEVTNFFAVDRGAVVDTRDAAASEQSAGEAVVRVPARLVVVLDDMHLHQGPRKRALVALKSYIGTMEPSTTVTLIRWNGALKTIVRPTADREALLKNIADMEREPSGMIRADTERVRAIRQIDDVILNPIPLEQDQQAAEAMANAVTYAGDRTREVERTLKALSEVITVMSGLEGRKTLLFVSEALAQQPGVDVFDYARQVFSRNRVEGFTLEAHTGGNAIDALHYDQTTAFRRLASLAQSAGVIVSALDPGGARGIEGTSSEFATMLARIDSGFIRQNESAGPRMIANETGGRYIENENDLQHAIAILTDDVSTYYSLGIRPPASSGRGSIAIKVKGRDDLRVLTPRRHALKSEEEAMASAVRARLYSREETNPLAVQVNVGTPWPRGTRCVAPVQVTVPPAKLTPLPDSSVSVHAIVLDDRGQESNVRTSTHPVSTSASQTIAFDFGFKPRRYVLSIAVREKATGETSYLQTDIDATICGR